MGCAHPSWHIIILSGARSKEASDRRFCISDLRWLQIQPNQFWILWGWICGIDPANSRPNSSFQDPGASRGSGWFSSNFCATVGTTIKWMETEDLKRIVQIGSWRSPRIINGSGTDSCLLKNNKQFLQFPGSRPGGCFNHTFQPPVSIPTTTRLQCGTRWLGLICLWPLGTSDLVRALPQLQHHVLKTFDVDSRMKVGVMGHWFCWEHPDRKAGNVNVSPSHIFPSSFLLGLRDLKRFAREELNRQCASPWCQGWNFVHSEKYSSQPHAISKSHSMSYDKTINKSTCTQYE